MRLEHSNDERGPLVALGDVEFSAETGLPGGRQMFKLPAYIVVTDEAQITVEYNGERLTDFGTWNDYYGFGTSPITAMKEGAKRLERLQGLNADICLTVTLTRTLCIPAAKDAFYNASQAVHTIPWTWRIEGEAKKQSKQEFLVWQNGQRTPQATEFYDEIMRLAAEDAAPNRKGEICTVATRKNPVSREQFLLSQPTSQ